MYIYTEDDDRLMAAEMAANKKTGEYRATLEKIATERVGMLQQLRQFGGCNTCKHFFEQIPDGCTFEGKCEDCLIVCECSGCIDHQNWEWCGPWEVNK